MTAHIRLLVLTSIFFTIVPAFSTQSAQAGSPHGLYVWTDETSTPQTRQALVNTCLDPTHPLGLVLLSDQPPYGYTTPERVANLHAFNTLAHQAGLSVYALYTDKNWISQVLQYNAQCLDATQRFDAYAMDYEAVEPSTANDVQYYADAKAGCGSLPLHVSIGWHWDNSIAYGGSTKPAYQHIVDLVDSVDVQTAFETADQIVFRAKEEVGYGALRNKLVFPTIETQDVAGVGGMSEWNTFFEEGESAMWDMLANVSFETGTFTGFILHYYGHAYNSGTAKWPSHVAADTQPPTIQSISASPSVLWPVNHKMVKVTLAVSATDNRDPAPVCKILRVTCNEAVNGPGDGKSQPDWEITGALTVNLRAERCGTGSGRVYAVCVECKDASGNAATGTVEVTVPHDQSKK